MKLKVPQARAARESTHPDGGQRLRELNRGQTGTVFKSITANLGDSVRFPIIGHFLGNYNVSAIVFRSIAGTISDCRSIRRTVK